MVILIELYSIKEQKKKNKNKTRKEQQE